MAADSLSLTFDRMKHDSLHLLSLRRERNEVRVPKVFNPLTYGSLRRQATFNVSLLRRAQEKGLSGNVLGRVGEQVTRQADDFFFFR